MSNEKDLFENTEAATEPTPEPTPEPKAAPEHTPGQLLKAAREQQGMTQQQLCDRLRLRMAVVKHIEADEYEQLGAATFVRGYLRSIARVLEVDEAEIFASYQALGYTAPATNSVKLQSFSRRQVRERNDNRLKWTSYVIIGIVISAAIVWWIQDSGFSLNTITGSDDAPSQAEFTASQEDGRISISARPTTTITPATGTIASGEAAEITEEQVQASDLSTYQEPADSAATESTSAAHETSDHTPTAPDAAATVTDIAENTTAEAAGEAIDEVTPEEAMSDSEITLDSLDFVFTDVCWVKVTDATGEDIAIGVKAKGYQMPLTGTAPFAIILCKPDAVEMTYNGEPVDLSSYRRGRSVTMTVGETQ